MSIKNDIKSRVDKPQSSKGSNLLIGIVCAIIIGTLVGGFLPNIALKMSVLGELFLNALMMLVIPLVMFSMIVGITKLGDIRNLGAIGGMTVLYYLMTTGIAVLIGIVLVNLIRPGDGISPGEKHPEYSYTISDKDNRTIYLRDNKWERKHYNDKYALFLLDQNVRGIIDSFTDSTVSIKLWEKLNVKDYYYIKSENGTLLPFYRKGKALISMEPVLTDSGKGVEIGLVISEKLQNKEGDVAGTIEEVLIGDKETGKQGMIPRNIFSAMAQMEILPLIIFSLLFGAALSVMGDRVRPTIEIISTLNDTIMKLVHWVMILAPIGIFGLIATRIGRAGGFADFIPELWSLGKYSFTVLFGLAIHGFIILPLILKLIGKREPFKYAKGVGAALLNAFSTASSSATLPLTLQGVEEENKVSSRTASFVLPLGATINMDGTALYEAVAAMFIAQIYGVEMTPFMQGIIFLTATLAAIGAAGIPEAGLVTMVIVLKAVNLPIEGIGLLLAIDWLLDRFRTTVNVWGDSVGAGVIETRGLKSKKIG